MARVFLSYDREDTDRARPIAVALEKAGHSVWWDRHIRSGTQFSQEIDEARGLVILGITIDDEEIPVEVQAEHDHPDHHH